MLMTPVRRITVTGGGGGRGGRREDEFLDDGCSFIVTKIQEGTTEPTALVRDEGARDWKIRPGGLLFCRGRHHVGRRHLGRRDCRRHH